MGLAKERHQMMLAHGEERDVVLQGAVFMFVRLIFPLVTETLNMKKNKRV